MGPALPQDSPRNFPAWFWAQQWLWKGIWAGAALAEHRNCFLRVKPAPGHILGCILGCFSCLLAVSALHKSPRTWASFPMLQWHCIIGDIIGVAALCTQKTQQAQAGDPTEPALEKGRGEAGAGRIYRVYRISIGIRAGTGRAG